MVQAELENFEVQLVQGSTKKAMHSANASSRDLWQVEIESIRVIDNFNVRIKDDKYDAHIRALADSMKSEGFYQDKPLAGYVAKDGEAEIIYITDGHCRYEAVKLAISEGAEIARVPVVVAPPGRSMEDLIVGLVRSNSGKPLEPYEIGIVCKRLVNYGWELEAIASRLGFSEKYVEGLLMLMAAPIEIRNMVQNGEVSASTAIEAIRKHGGQALAKLQKGLDNAKAAGGERVTKKHLPEVIFKKKVAKAAPQFFSSLQAVKADPGYEHISPELREKLDVLMAEFGDLELSYSNSTEGDSNNE